ncbi:SPFH/Band 7/PHB domain protein [Dictyocaulus viviparus]|uniref:SPFH/Band 7/PHB domain protein n=1 Tax=Dictyocaulus viviparus TaxID=29172 RepID=A0A0D8Y4T6_DICVI|nr:SPFH/Band 7/PHB domain protein [Dictyocaulus viviparus]
MTFASIRYAALCQEDDDGNDNLVSKETENAGFKYGMPEGTFESAFTYAKYNDLDRMGYEAPTRQGNMLGNRYSNFTYAKDFDEEEKEIPPMNVIELVIFAISMMVVILTMPFSLLFAIKFISTSERLVVFRLGRAQKTRGPGATFVVPCIDSTYKINISTTAFNVPPLQLINRPVTETNLSQIITMDRGLVELGATVFLRIRDPVAAVCSIQDRNTSTRTLANTMLYRYISKKRVCEITNGHDRRVLAGTLKDELGSFTQTYGVEITNIEISDAKIIKEGENMGLSALSAVVRSDVGQKLWEVIAPHVEEFARSKIGENSKVVDESSSKESDPDLTSCTENPLINLAPINNVNMDGMDTDQLITIINMAIDEQLAKTIGRTFQINCNDISPIFIDLKHLPGSCGKGVIPNADVVLEMKREIFLKIITEDLSPVNAYLEGSLKLTGQIQDALSLKHLVHRVKQLL